MPFESFISSLKKSAGSNADFNIIDRNIEEMPLVADFWLQHTPNTRVFYFNENNPAAIPAVDIMAMDQEQILPDINLPFPVCYFESLSPGGLITINNLVINSIIAYEDAPKEIIMMVNATPEATKALNSLQAKSFSNWEIGLPPDGTMTMNITTESERWMDYLNRTVLNPVLARLQNGRLFQSSDKETIRIRSGSAKGIHKIRNIIYVGKRSEKSHQTPTGKTIEYSHRFEVRGHWRKLERGLGKNRAGERVVTGFTWVNDHTKGDESLPLVKKIRFCTEEDTPECK
jgi:hypothetical protein